MGTWLVKEGNGGSGVSNIGAAVVTIGAAAVMVGAVTEGVNFGADFGASEEGAIKMLGGRHCEAAAATPECSWATEKGEGIGG